MTNLSKTFDDSFKKEVIELIKQGLKKELPTGAVYSASKKPPEGAREFTTDRGTKYWIPGKKDKEDSKPKQAKPKSSGLFDEEGNLTPEAEARAAESLKRAGWISDKEGNLTPPKQAKPKVSTPRLANKQKFLKDSTLKKIPPLYGTEDIPTEEKIVYAKFFSPSSDMSWFATEYDPEQKKFFGYVGTPRRPEDAEWGYFDLKELQDNNIERDAYWDETKNFKDAWADEHKLMGYEPPK